MRTLRQRSFFDTPSPSSKRFARSACRRAYSAISCSRCLFSLIRIKEKRHLEHEIAEYARRQAERAKRLEEGEGVSKNERWRKVLTYIFSPNSADWKLAIIEADSMLEALLSELGFQGENLGEKLKGATKDSFRPLSSAWEVHTVRNKIAHEGLGYDISQQEAKRLIAIYEQIFREFGYI